MACSSQPNPGQVCQAQMACGVRREPRQVGGETNPPNHLRPGPKRQRLAVVTARLGQEQRPTGSADRGPMGEIARQQNPGQRRVGDDTQPSAATSPSGRRTACSHRSTGCCGNQCSRKRARWRVSSTQSVKTSTSEPASNQVIDVGKKTSARRSCRKRSVITDTLGLPLAVLVTATRAGLRGRHTPARADRRGPAHNPRSPGRRRLPPALRRTRRHPPHRSGNHPTPARYQGVQPIPKHWAVERTYG